MDKAYTLDERKHHLAHLCAQGHDWNNTGKSLRYLSNGKCVQCQKERSSRHYQRNRELVIARTREWQRQNPIASAENAARVKAYRQKQKEQGTYVRSRYGLPYGFLSENDIPVNYASRVAELLGRGMNVHEIKDILDLESKYLEKIGYSLTVAQLVHEEQKRYWRENPESRRLHESRENKHRLRLRYMTDESLRLYNREKSKRRKAQNRGQIAVAIPASALRRRFNEFGNRCAYCGNRGFMQIEHVIAICNDGLHDISNIVPACLRCNYSKGRKDMEDWYRSQAFFCQARLDTIQRITAISTDTQLSLAVG